MTKTGMAERKIALLRVIPTYPLTPRISYQLYCFNEQQPSSFTGKGSSVDDWQQTASWLVSESSLLICARPTGEAPSPHSGGV